MMNETIFNIEVASIVKSTLVFLRIAGILFFLPIFGDVTTPIRARMILAGGLTFLFFNLVPATWQAHLSFDVISMTWLIFKELFIGFTIGFIAKVAFDGLIMAASIVGYQMGFGMANLLVPDAGQQLNAFTAFHRLLMILLFLSLNLHHTFISGIAETFRLIPIGAGTPVTSIGHYMIEITSGIFLVSLQLSAPILVALLFTMAALGLMARTVPQMNVFTLSFPASFFIGLLVYLASFSLYPEWIKQHFSQSYEDTLGVLQGMAP